MKLLVQGWRFIHHSYALVAQAYCVSLLRRGDVELRFEDLPFAAPGWQPSRGIPEIGVRRKRPPSMWRAYTGGLQRLNRSVPSP
jgi:hypothetical protein